MDEQDLRDMQMEAKFQTQLLTQQGMWTFYTYFYLYVFHFSLRYFLKKKFSISFVNFIRFCFDTLALLRDMYVK